MSKQKRRFAMVAVTALLTLLATAMPASPAQAADGAQNIKNWAAQGQCLEATGLYSLDVFLSSCNGLFTQAWDEQLFPIHDHTACCVEFHSVSVGTCLSTDHTTVEMQGCIGDLGFNSHQLWRVWYAFNPALPETRGWFQQLQNVKTGYCLTVAADGAAITTAPCDPRHANLAQRWAIRIA